MCQFEKELHWDVDEYSRWQALWESVASDRSKLYPTTPVSAVKTDLKHLPQTENLLVWLGLPHTCYRWMGNEFLWIPYFMRHHLCRSSGDRLRGQTSISRMTCRR